MQWVKLDDTTVVVDQPLSAFVGKSLADNVNTYDKQLTRLATFAYPTTSTGGAKVKWASYNDRRGTIIVVDVGNNAITFVVKVFYKTTNAALGGKIYVQDIDTGWQVYSDVPGSASPTSIDIAVGSSGLSGRRAFLISFQSDIGESAGQVQLAGAVGNQVFCEPTSPVQFPFTLAPDSYTEMYHVLYIGAAGAGPAPLINALPAYQVCAFKHNLIADQPPDGVLVVWPEIEINPPILTTSTTGGGGGPGLGFAGTLYELGRLELFSVSVETSWPALGSVRSPYVYQQPTSLNRINNQIDSAMANLQPNAATHITSDSFLGCVLPAGEEATFAFFVQTNKSVQQLLTTFRAVAYTATDVAPDITFGVRDYLGNTVGTDITHENMPVPRITGQTTVNPQDGTAMFMNGVLAGDVWGMRDAMPIQDAAKGLAVRFAWGPNVATEIAQGSDGTTDAVYYGTITATANLYIYGFNCKVL